MIAKRVVRSFIVAVLIQASASQSPIDPSKTLIWGDGLVQANAGEISKFYIQNRDAGEQNATGPGNQVSVECISPPDKPKDFCHELPTYTNLGNGLWEVTFVVGTVWSSFVHPIYLPPPPVPRPLAADYFYKGDNYFKISVGDPFVEIPQSPTAPTFGGEPILYPLFSSFDTQFGPFGAGMVRSLGVFSDMRDRFANVIRPDGILERLEPVATLTALGYVGPRRLYKPPVISGEWVLYNWYISFHWTCFSAGHYDLELIYRWDQSSGEKVRLLNKESGLSQVANITCSPSAVAENNFEVQMAPTARVGETLHGVIYSLDSEGNSAFLVRDWLHFKHYSVGDQEADVLVIKIHHDDCDCLDGNLTYSLDDRVPGKLHFTLDTTRSGKYTLYLEYDGVELNETYQVEFEPLEPDPDSSEVDESSFGGGEMILVAGKSTTITILLKDRYGNPSPGLVPLLGGVATKSGDSSIPPLTFTHAILKSFGEYELRIEHLNVVGTYYLDVMYNGKRVKYGRITVNVIHSPTIDPYYSDVTGTGIGIEIGAELHMLRQEFWQPAGRNLSLIVKAADQFGNPHIHTSPDFKINSAFREACAFFSSRDNSDGTTVFRFVIEKKGVYPVVVSTPSNATAYESNLEITPAGVTHTMCNVFGFGDVVAGAQSVGYLQIVDKYMNIHEDSALINIAVFEVSFRLHDQPFYEKGVVAKIGEYDPEHRGNIVTYELERAGTYILTAKWVDWPMKGSNQQFQVDPGQVSGAHCLLEAWPGAVSAGANVRINVVGYDAFDNFAAATDYSDQVQVEALGAVGTVNNITYRTERSRDEPWKVGIIVTLEGIGDYSLRVKVGGVNVPMSPVTGYKVSAGEFDAHHSPVSGAGVEIASVGAWNEVTITGNDEFGNRLENGALNHRLDFNVTGSAEVQLHTFPATASSNQYTARYLPLDRGVFLVSVIVDGDIIPGFPISVDAIYPGDIPDRECQYGILGKPNCGDNGQFVSCECVCDPGWFTSFTGQSLLNVTFCNEFGDDVLAPGPSQSQPPQESIIDLYRNYALVGGGVGLAIAILYLLYIWRRNPSDDDSDGSDSEDETLGTPTFHGGMLAKSMQMENNISSRSFSRGNHDEFDKIPAYIPTREEFGDESLPSQGWR